MVVPIDTVSVFDQLSIVDVPPPIAITDTGNVPGGGVSSGYGLTQFYYLARLHNAKGRPAKMTDRPQLMKRDTIPATGQLSCDSQFTLFD
jgi:hypothetical protein